MHFVGRSAELKKLQTIFNEVNKDASGLMLSIRGRRQVGKSRLVEHFLTQLKAPSFFFTATKGASRRAELADFASGITSSNFQNASLLEEVKADGWPTIFRLLTSIIKTPSVVVIDELPYLLEQDSSLEGTLQWFCDRELPKIPLFLIVIGSDLSTMEMLGHYDRPLFQRMRELVIEPFNVAETSKMLGFNATDTFDAHLVLGGFPRIAETWRKEKSLDSYLKHQLTHSTSPLIVVGERILNAEFPQGMQAREILKVVGKGATTFANIASKTGINQGSLTRSLQMLVNDKRVLTVERPLCSKPTRNALYKVADTYLSFWLRFIEPNMNLLLRERGDIVARLIKEQWPTYSGRAIEPIIRKSVERMLPDDRFNEAMYVGSYWTRSNDSEVDLIGADKADSPAKVSFIGSINWRDKTPFNKGDLFELAAHRKTIPGADEALLIGVSRSGFSTSDLDVALSSEDLLNVWRS